MGYRIIGITQTEEVQGGNKIVPVREFHVMSTPSETYFQFRRGKRGGEWIAPASSAKQLSDRIEAVMKLPDVVDVVYSQDVTPGGKLIDWMTTFYRTEDGAITGSVESSLAEFGPNYTGAQISREIASGGDVLTSG